MQLSKSDYMMFLRHPAWMWLKKHDKGKLPEFDEATLARFKAGHDFEELVYDIFPGGHEIAWDGYEEYLSMPKRTMEAIESGENIIFQGRFESGGITCIVDILKKTKEGSFDLYEVKSSASVKKDHYYDLAFQVAVIEGAGIKINDVFVTHVNSDYVRNGEIKAKDISTTENVTSEVKDLAEETRENIKRALSVLDSPEMPDPSPRYLNNKFSGTSDWIAVLKNIKEVDRFSIYNLAGRTPDLVGSLEDAGIEMIEDIHDGFNLNERQAMQVYATKKDERIIRKGEISDFLNSLNYPLYFLDYETAGSALPLHDGTRPYQQIPFQYSLHVIDKPGGEVRHAEYLHKEKSLPVPNLLKSLKENIGDEGSVLAWHDSFEKRINKSMGEMFPEYKEFLESLNERSIDLKIPFSKNWFVDKDFLGSASIKNVLPVLAPEVEGYTGLNIAGGDAAQLAWMNWAAGNDLEDEENLFRDLEEYCRLDTLAMVKIFKKLKDFC